MRERVGASIVEIITESLYDKPIVVFREYVQNSADSLAAAEHGGHAEDLSVRIWTAQNDLFFLDNGIGIRATDFVHKMSSIAYSSKVRSENIGYKGIGRLSGLAYCSELSFINILDFQRQKFQRYTIDCLRYAQMRKEGRLSNLDFSDLMRVIAREENGPEPAGIMSILAPHASMFAQRNTGFLVVLKGISPVLSSVITDKNFLENLAWLLPVPFREELLEPASDSQDHELFDELCNSLAFPDSVYPPAKSYRVFFEEKPIQRPITRGILRQYLCKTSLGQYAVCVSNFSSTGITIDNKNSFSGVRMYIDNILLCDESELVPALLQFGMISHTKNEMIQALRGIGAMIYIVDKVNISANARRTFIDVTDDDSLNFLRLLGEFVESIFQARYALSRYYSAKKKDETQQEALNDLHNKAEDALVRLARQEVALEDEPVPQKEFSRLDETEQKRIIKSKLSKELNARIKNYLAQTTAFNPDSCVGDFLKWLKANWH